MYQFVTIADMFVVQLWERKRDRGEFRRAGGRGESGWGQQHFIQIRRLKEVNIIQIPRLKEVNIIQIPRLKDVNIIQICRLQEVNIVQKFRLNEVNIIQ